MPKIGVPNSHPVPPHHINDPARDGGNGAPIARFILGASYWQTTLGCPLIAVRAQLKQGGEVWGNFTCWRMSLAILSNISGACTNGQYGSIIQSESKKYCFYTDLGQWWHHISKSKKLRVTWHHHHHHHHVMLAFWHYSNKKFWLSNFLCISYICIYQIY